MSHSFYVTTPIYYVNDIPHIGHVYTTVAADVAARFHRASGRRVRFLTGTDEHGQKIEKAAGQQGLQPIQLADRVVEKYRKLWQRLHVSYDDFIRTTEPRHQRVVQAFYQRIRSRDDIYLGEYAGWYCTGCEEYYTETQLDQGCCPIHKTRLDRIKEKSYFFRMSKYTQALLDHIQSNPRFIQPEIRRNEIVSFVGEGLRDLSISRTSFRWGVPVPDDPKHIIYVWFDALANYISALDWDGSVTGGESFERFWPAVHFIGKDILRFHAVYWPCFLLSAGIPLPKTVFAHGWWTVEGEKMSKSLRNTVEPDALISAYGVDAVRYFMLREVPFGLDGDFSHQALVGRLNAELANDLGNLLRRSITMAEKYTRALTPAPKKTQGIDEALANKALEAARSTREHLEQFAFHKALVAIWELVRAANRYIDEAGPWTLHKNGDRERLDTVIFHTLEAIRFLGVLVWPFMPETGSELLSQLGLYPLSSETGATSDGYSDLMPGKDAPELLWKRIDAWGGLPVGTRVRKGPPLFPRIESKQAAELVSRIQQASPSVRESPSQQNEISLDELKKLDLRVGLVKSVEKVKKSDKLIKLLVDLGETTPRQIVAGIGKAYSPEQLIGKRIMVLANLKPVKLMGVESRGMLLATGSYGEQVVVAEFVGQVEPGASIR